MPTVDPGLVFLDANVLARPVTRTLLLVGADPARVRIVWSRHAEEEANRHLRQRSLSVTELRSLLGRALGPSGSDTSRFTDTDAKDRQILADVEASGAAFLVTANVDDFGQDDLIRLRVAAVDPDLFMATRYPLAAYRLAIDLMAERMTHPDRTAAELHSLMAREHPRLFARHPNAYDSRPAPSHHRPPSVTFRGARCVACGRVVDSPDTMKDGLGPDCGRDS